MNESRWVLLPEQPTEEMRTAHAMYGDTSDWWNAVVAAAPAAPTKVNHAVLECRTCGVEYRPSHVDGRCAECSSPIPAARPYLEPELLRWVKAQAADPDANERFRELYSAITME